MSSSMSRASERTTTRPGEQPPRQRPNTRSAPQPPPLDLQSPLSHSSRSTRETRSRSRPSPAGSSMLSSDSYYSPSSSSRASPLYGSQTTLSPLTLSPDSLTPFGDITSSSLPVSLSALADDPNYELVSPASIISSRPSSSPRTRSPAHHHHNPQSPSSPRLASHLSHSNLRIHTSSTTTPRSAPISRKPSDNSLDRDAGFHLDMKRLLSKPAQPSHSGSSVISIPSDAEFSGGSPHNSRHPLSFSHQVQSSQRVVDVSPIRRATDTPKAAG